MISGAIPWPTSYSIGKHFEEMIAGLLESGRYSTASEVMREGLRLVGEREERRKVKLEALRAEIQKGFDSGPAEERPPVRVICENMTKGKGRICAEKVPNRFRKSRKPARSDSIW